LKNSTSRTKQVFKIPGRSTSSKRICINSDLHVGSNYAVTCIDGPYKPTRYQIVAREHWLECSDKVGKHELHIMNGENANGINKKQMGAYNYTSDMITQTRHSIKAMLEWRFENILVTRGSGYHSSDGAWTWYEEIFAQEIGAVPNGEEDGEFTDDETAFFFAGKVFNCAHHVPGSIWFHYSTTPLTREGMGLALNRTKYYNSEQVKHIDVIIRSHRHHRHFTDIEHQLLCATPCWQFRNPYMRKSGMGSLYPTIGCIWFDVEQNGEIYYHKNDLPDWKIPKKELLEFCRPTRVV